ncbi:MAG: hypothetical protein WCG85_26820, partial [Polyangia bacterium]
FKCFLHVRFDFSTEERAGTCETQAQWEDQDRRLVDSGDSLDRRPRWATPFGSHTLGRPQTSTVCCLPDLRKGNGDRGGL